MRARLTSMVGLIVASVTLAVSTSPAIAASVAPTNEGAFTCVPATAANKVAPPPPIWETSGTAPTSQEVAYADSIKRICPSGDVASPVPNGLGAPLDTPNRGEANSSGGSQTNNVSGNERFAVAPGEGGTGCSVVDEELGCYWHVTAQDWKTAVGMEYAASVAEPKVSSFPGAHSLDQLAVTLGGESHLRNTLEVGVIVDPGMFGKSTKPHFFTFVNNNDYGNEGNKYAGEPDCYDCHFTEYYESKFTPGMELPVNVVPFRIGVEFWGGKWWISAAGKWVGYIAPGFWNDEFEHGELELSFGEVFDSAVAPTSEMGNGLPGTNPAASVMDAPVIFHTENEEETTCLESEKEQKEWHEGKDGKLKCWLQQYAENSELYSLGQVSAGSTEWHFGGPGIDPHAPSVTTGRANDVAQTEATANGEVDPNNLETRYRFEWGTTTSYGNDAPSTEGGKLAADSKVYSVSAKLTGLTPGATYHYRLVASNADGTTYGTDQALKTDASVGLINASGGALYSPEPFAVQWKTISPTTNHPSMISVGELGAGYIDSTGAYWSKEPGAVAFTELSDTSAKPTAISVSGSLAGLINSTGAVYSPEPLSMQWKSLSPASNNPSVISVGKGGVGYIDSTGAYWSKEPASVPFTKLCGAEAKPTAISVSGSLVGLINSTGAVYSPEPLSMQWKAVSPASSHPSVISVGKGGVGYIDSTGAYWSKEPPTVGFTELTNVSAKPTMISVDDSSVGLINVNGAYWSAEPFAFGWTQVSAASAEPTAVSVG
jgi:hypothetical protein